MNGKNRVLVGDLMNHQIRGDLQIDILSMLEAKNLENDYWDEFVTSKIYIINSCPTKSVKNMIPEEELSGTKHNVCHMRLLGCVSYVHGLNEFGMNLDKKGEKCICVGYSDEYKDYMLYNPLTKKVIINIDM